MSERKKGNFTLQNRISFKEINEDTELPESDLCFQDESYIFQFKYNEPEKKFKESIKPGIMSLISTTACIKTKEVDLRDNKLLGSVDNTRRIKEESDAFFDNLDIYEELDVAKTRKLLLFSDPGMGKSVTITEYCKEALASDPGTVILLWPTSQIDSGDASDFLSKYSEYTDACTRMILVMEDIGGGGRDSSPGPRSVDSAMLEMLDGLQDVFKLPTLILATTNYPAQLLSALADRPGRFDFIMELPAPSAEERVELLEFISKGKCNDDDRDAIRKKGKDFSIAYIKEIVVRSRLHKRSISVVIDEIVEHRENFKKGFEDRKAGSFGFGS